MSTELEELRNVIKQWNENRLDLFEISEPNEELEFHGVMRFYFQDTGLKVATKCIRVSSTASTNDVIEILIEKFRPDIRMLTLNAEYALYEIHENGEERKLENIEKPLVVQLNWNKDDREGRFLLRRMNEKTMLPGFNEASKGKSSLNGKSSDDNTFKRKLSKREKKEKKKKEKEGKLNDENDESKEKLAEKLYNEAPETIFTRSISNPEAVMKRKRAQKLEKKLQQLVDEGGSQAGGTLRIFGEKLNKNVPYKTVLLSIKDNSQFAIREILKKYNLEKENPKDYCLVQLIVPPNLANLDKDQDLDLNTIQNLSENIKENVLNDEDCPLVYERLHNKNSGISTFHIRKKPENFTPNKQNKNQSNEERPYFIEVNPQDGKSIRKHIFTHNYIEVGCSNAPNANLRGKQQQNDRQHLHLVGGNVAPKHCVITYSDGIVTLTPDQDPEAETFVNNLKITDSYILKHGMVVRFGKVYTFNFVDPTFERKKNQLSPDLLSQMQNSKLNSIHNNNNNGYSNEQQHIYNNEDQLSNYSKKSEQQQPPTTLQIHHNQQIENLPSHQQQFKKNEAILPAILELWEETEDSFLNSIITNVDVNQVQFKLAPTYTIYLAIRYRASTRFRPTATVEERAVRLTEFTNKFCQMIKYVIHINHSDPSRLAFWLANSSELLHFLKQDRHISAFTVDGQELLAESVQIAFKKLVTCLEIDLDNSMINLLSENEQEATAVINKMLNVLNGAMALLRNCRVNAALTIQLFSQIFHYINIHLFNQVTGLNRNENTSININYCTERWGRIINQRLIQIIHWAKKQGLELAADCYLNTIFQAATDLENGRGIRLPEDTDLHLTFLLPEDGYFCDSIKGVPPGLQEFILPMVVHKLCDIAIEPRSAGHWTIFLNNYSPNNNTINTTNISNNTSIPTPQPTTPTINMMNHPPHFLIPANSVPTRTVSTQHLGLSGISTPVHHLQPNYLAAQQQIYGQQTPFNPNQLNLIQQHQQQTQQQPSFIQQKQPEITIIKLKKGNHGMGLSIVAARSSAQEQFGIYIKSVVPGGCADCDGRLKAGDQLLKVDNHSLIGISQERAAELMTQTGPIVTLEVAKAAAHYNGLVSSFLSNNNSPRMPPLKNNFNNRMLPAMHSANTLIIPKSQTSEHLKQHSSSLINLSLNPYSTFPQQNIHQQQQLAMIQLAMQQQQQQQQQQALLQQQISNHQRYQQQQQVYLRNQKQQQFIQQAQQQEEKLNKLKLTQLEQDHQKQQQFINEPDELLNESQSSSIKKLNNNLMNDNWQQQLLQKTQEEQEERLQKLKLEESKLKEEYQVAEEVEKRLISEARKRKEDPLKNYSQQISNQQSSEDTDNNSDEGITVQQQQRLERLLSRNYQNVSSNGIVTLPPSLPSSTIQQTQLPSQTTIIQSKSALRNKDPEQNGDLNGTNKMNTNKKVSWKEEEENEVIESNEDNYEDDYPNDCSTIININENGETSQSTKDKIESSFTLQDIAEVLGGPNETDDFSNSNQPNNTPNVIGAQEVYRDPRDRIKAEKMKQQNSTQPQWTSEVPETLSFKEKMKMFGQINS